MKFAKMIQQEVVDAWTSVLASQLATLNEPQHALWYEMLTRCDGATSSKPTKKFLKQTGEVLMKIGHDSFANFATPIIESVGTAHANPVKYQGTEWSAEDPTFVHEKYADRLRGLIWVTSLVDDRLLYSAITSAASRCFQKVPGVGPRNVKVGNACLWVFSQSESLETVAQLTHLRTRVKHVSVKKQIDRSLEAAAARHGMSRDDLDDLAIPTCGLTDPGIGKMKMGDYVAELKIVSTHSIVTTWTHESGKTQKSIPKSVKENHASELKLFKADRKQMKEALTGQRDRLESTYFAPRTWDFKSWRQRYLDHPMLGWLTRRLIWNFGSKDLTVPGMWHDGDLVDHTGSPLAELTDETVVTLWHPIENIDDPESVKAWRQWLLDHQITQPFKQAHREVYALTDAERSTGHYSNRYAAHIIKQHQFKALSNARNWSYSLMGQWDSYNRPTKALPHHKLFAEFWVEAANDEVGDTGVFMYLATDQVRFYAYDPDQESVGDARWNGDDDQPLSLDAVPPLVFSEVMRDCDLFVGVASVGNDPAWEDGGDRGAFNDYWHTFSFGDLSESAEMRRQTLEQIVPRLKISDRCSFESKFLVVRGDLRTYKIHLGSSNILMEPNDQYLCIVPARSIKTEGKVFLPFEGDQRLSVILSKALMLADDKKIKDKTILNQING